MKCFAIILSGGTGSRMKMDIPKQYIEVDDRMIITESIRPFLKCGLVSDVRIVADEMWRDKIVDEYRVLSGEFLGELSISMLQVTDDIQELYKLHGFSAPGANRQLSIYNALEDIRADISDKDLVIIHDAARPLVTVEMIEACINALYGDDLIPNEHNTDYGNENKDIDNDVVNEYIDSDHIIHDGAMPVLPMKDTVYLSEDGKAVSSLINRDQLFAGQAPEVFVYGKYLEACEKLLPNKIMDIRGSSEPAIIANMDIVMVPGDEGNFKITTREDFERYKEIVVARR